MAVSLYRSRRKKFFPQAAGLSATSVVTETTTLFSDGNILASDTPIILPSNVAAAALMGNALGLFAVCTDGVCTITHAAAAGGEIFHVVIIPQGMID